MAGNSIDTNDADADELSSSMKVLTTVIIVIFPIFMFACQWLLHQVRMGVEENEMKYIELSSVGGHKRKLGL